MAAPVTPSFSSGDAKVEEESPDQKTLMLPPANETGIKVQLDFDKGHLDMLMSSAAAVSVEDFYNVSYELGKALLVKHGGPRQYLLAQFPHDISSAGFVEGLRKQFDYSRLDVSFAKCVPDNDTQIFQVHLWDLSWFPEASTKPAPFLTTSLQLLDEYLKNNFLTEGIPAADMMLLCSYSCLGLLALHFPRRASQFVGGPGSAWPGLCLDFLREGSLPLLRCSLPCCDEFGIQVGLECLQAGVARQPGGYPLQAWDHEHGHHPRRV